MEPGFVAAVMLSCLVLPPTVAVLTFGFIGLHGRKGLDREIAEREQRVAHLLLVNTPDLGPGRTVTLVIGSVVYAPDAAARNAHRWRRLFGGSGTSMRRRVEAARRLATVRALEQAGRLGAGAVLNVRYETSRLEQGSRSRRRPLIEMIAYGTAWVPTER